MQNTDAVSEVKISHRPFIRWTLMAAGTVLVGIGILGIFLPLLPTTVFFLMAAWCYARSSQRFYDWLHKNPLFGKYLKNYREGRGISKTTRIVTIVFLWGGILYSIFVTQSVIAQIVLAAIAVGVTIHLVMIPTYSEE